MSKSTYWLALVLLVGIGLPVIYNIGNSGAAFACSCREIPSPVDALNKSAVVFTGRVVEVTKFNHPTRIGALFDVHEVWKGVSQDRVIIYTSGPCGFPFEKNGEYLVYAGSDKEGGLGTGICSNTKLLSDAQTDLAALREGQDPLDVVTERFIELPPVYMIIGFPLAVIAALVGAVIGWKGK